VPRVELGRHHGDAGHLGESVTSLEEAAEARMLPANPECHPRSKIQGNVSLKLTQFGIDLSEEACRANVGSWWNCGAPGEFCARGYGEQPVRDRTIQLVVDLYSKFGHVGVVIQAYLYRQREGHRESVPQGITVRLLRELYLEHADVAFPQKAKVDANYVELMKGLLDHGPYRRLPRTIPT